MDQPYITAMKPTIEEILVEEGYISRQQLRRLRLFHKKCPERSVTELLTELGYADETRILMCAAGREHLEVADLKKLTPDPDVLSLIPAGFAVRNRLLPLSCPDQILTMACGFPLPSEALAEASLLTGREIRPVLVPSGELEDAVRAAYAGAKEETRKEHSGETQPLKEEFLTEEGDETAPAVRMVNRLIETAYRENASDIHVEPGRKTCIIRLRINGDLERHGEMELSFYHPMVTRLKLMGGMDIAEKRLPQDGKYRYQRGEIATDLRISTLPSVYGEKVVLRLLGNDRDRRLMDIRQLGMEPEQMGAFERMIKSPYGLVLVTGPTGSGKSTTLYAVLSRLAEGKINVVTVEDPVEKEIEGTVQVQVNTRAGLNFASALRSILRQDPDVIMVGEMRGEETAAMGVRAAITGHLVLSTLHTNDCPAVVNRLRNMGVPSYMIAAALTGAVAQRLVKVLCPCCKRRVKARQEQRQTLCRLAGKAAEEVWEAPGCESCRGTGYIHRRAIYEIMEVDGEIKEMILQEESAARIRKALRERGCPSLKDQAARLVAEGEIDLKEAERILYFGE